MVVYIACHVVCVSNTSSYVHTALLYYIKVVALYQSGTAACVLVVMISNVLVQNLLHPLMVSAYH